MNIDDISLIEGTFKTVSLKLTGRVIVVPDDDDRTVVEAAAVGSGLSLLRMRAAGEYLRPGRRERVRIVGDDGKTYEVTGAQQLAKWTAMVFEKVAR